MYCEGEDSSLDALSHVERRLERATTILGALRELITVAARKEHNCSASCEPRVALRNIDSTARLAAGSD